MTAYICQTEWSRGGTARSANVVAQTVRQIIVNSRRQERAQRNHDKKAKNTLNKVRERVTYGANG